MDARTWWLVGKKAVEMTKLVKLFN